MSNIRSLNSQPSFWDFVSDYAAQQPRGNDGRHQSRDTFHTEDTLLPEDIDMGGGPEHVEPAKEHNGSTEKPNDEAGPSQPPRGGPGSQHDERSRSRSHSRSHSPRGRRHGHGHSHDHGHGHGSHGPHGMRHGGGGRGGHRHGGPHPHGPPHMHGAGHHFGGGRGGGGFRGRGGGGGCTRGWGGGAGWGGFGRQGPFGQHPWASAYGGGQGGPFDMDKLAEYFSAAASMFNQHVAGGARDANAGTDNTRSEDFRPQVDVFDTPSSYIVHVSLPGAKKEDVVVHWKAERQELEIAGVVYRPGVDEEMNSMLELGEREVGVFTRAVKLGTPEKPAGIDEEGIAAKLEDGVLRVGVPKLKEAEFVQVRRVDVM